MLSCHWYYFVDLLDIPCLVAASISCCHFQGNRPTHSIVGKVVLDSLVPLATIRALLPGQGNWTR